MADLADRAVAVIGGHVNQDGDAAGSVALEHHFLDLAALEFAGAALYGALDVVGGHAGRLGRQDGGAQPGIGVGIAAAAAGSDHDLLDNTGKRLAALSVGGGLLMLDRSPL